MRILAAVIFVLAVSLCASTNAKAKIFLWGDPSQNAKHQGRWAIAMRQREDRIIIHYTILTSYRKRESCSYNLVAMYGGGYDIGHPLVCIYIAPKTERERP